MNSKVISKRTFLATSATALCGLATQSGTAHAAESTARTFRIGTFDSRAIAIAYCNSATGKKALDAVRADYARAKAAKDEKRMKALEAQMKTRQRRQHEQGFSTASVINLLQSVKADLPALAKEAGVELLVSKWEVTLSSPTVETVDVTSQLVNLFHPSDQALKWIKDIQTKAPIPIDELPDHLD